MWGERARSMREGGDVIMGFQTLVNGPILVPDPCS